MRIRLRLVHTLSLFLLSFVALSLLATGGLFAWNLRNGFADYVKARDREQLEQFAGFVAGRMQAHASGGYGDADLEEWLREFGGQQGLSPPPPGPEMQPPGRGMQPPGPGMAPPGVHGAPGGRDGLAARVSLLDAQGNWLAGRLLRADEPADLQRVMVAGHAVALLRQGPGSAPIDAVDIRFLRRQYLGISLISALLLLLSIGAAAWLANRVARPLLEINRVTARIARGESGVQLDGRLADNGSAEIADTVHNINHMAASLTRIESTRRRWLADISHELRTPLTVLRGELEALHDGVRPLDAAAVVSLREEVQRLGSIVDDLHVLAIADLRGLPCHFADLDVAALLRQTAQRFMARAAQAQLQLTIHVPDDPVIACWDSTRIEQLLGNLLTNSLRYTDAPGRIELTLTPQGKDLELRVEDSAPGVTPEQAQRLFEPLYRTDTGRDREHGGSGLGLAICEAIVRAHGGRIVADAAALGGVSIRVTLPRLSPGAA